MRFRAGDQGCAVRNRIIAGRPHAKVARNLLDRVTPQALDLDTRRELLSLPRYVRDHCAERTRAYLVDRDLNRALESPG